MTGLSKKQEKGIGALLSQPTLVAAAQNIGVNEVTLRRWLKSPDFLAEYRKARRESVEQSVAVLQKASINAVATLVASLKANSEGVRLRAATAILEHAIKAVELMDLEERIATLEAKANGGME
jgi:hypothetical protein